MLDVKKICFTNKNLMHKQFECKIFAREEDDRQGWCVLLKFGYPYTGHTLQNTPIGRGDTYVSTFQRELPPPLVSCFFERIL